ncbi:hypothetical protein [Nonomuraea typhae]|uniref:Uncharacterized protein n=1 Tax=Nonomuraea typhae TaxID=2603600 RepID=A0ABW7YKX3_9ACTN
MHHQTTVEEQVEEAEREHLRAEIRRLVREDDEINGKYPNHADMPQAEVRRSIEIYRCLGELHIRLGECRHCGKTTIPQHAYCQQCVDDMQNFAAEMLAKIRAEESE